MRRVAHRVAVVMAATLVAGPAVAGQVFVYPEKGQNAKQQDQDEGACTVWAKQQTGFDPAAGVQATAPPPPHQAPQGGFVRGGARGAAVGAIGGAIAGDAGKGAAIGAAAGSMMGGMRRRDQVRNEAYAQQQWASQQASQYEQKLENYNRAYATCLQGRGYSVSN
jgi:hypothetical protein